VIYVENASKKDFFNYQDCAESLFELCDNEIIPIPVELFVYRRPINSPLSAAVERAKKGESKVYAIKKENYSDIVMYEIEDYQALLMAFGEGESDHRHHIVWEYSSRDDGRPTAKIKMTFKCGCVLNANTARTFYRELREQHKIEIVLKDVPDNNTSPTAEIGVRRCDIRDKPHELK